MSLNYPLIFLKSPFNFPLVSLKFPLQFAFRHARVRFLKLERGKNLGHSNLDRFPRTKVQKLISLFSRGKRPEFRRKRDLYEPLLTAMAQILPFLARPLCRNVSGIFVVQILEDFAGDFPRGFFGHFFPQK